MTELNRAQKQILKAAADFAKGEFDKDQALDGERDSTFPHAIWKKAAELGFIGVHFPERYGGGGMGWLEACLINEAFCRQDSSIGMALAMAASGADGLVRYGSDAVKTAYLPQIAEGAIRCGFGFYESGCGSDLAGVAAVAEKKDDGWMINGAKSHVWNGGDAGVYLLLCRTVPDAPGEKGLSLFAVDADHAGITVRDAGRKLGGNMVACADLVFTDVAVPAGNLLGKEGQGLAQADAIFEDAGILVAAQCLGTAAGALDRALDYVREREQFQRKLAVFEVTRQKIAAMALQVEQARVMTYAAARGRDGGKANGRLDLMARVTAGRAAVRVADEAIQLFGGYGYMKESEVERFYRDAKTADLTLGGAVHLKNKIAGSIIGKIK
jgi:alkylation response protein AidB-like acyl-CoA dehydrogenase